MMLASRFATLRNCYTSRVAKIYCAFSCQKSHVDDSGLWSMTIFVHPLSYVFKHLGNATAVPNQPVLRRILSQRVLERCPRTRAYRR